MIKNAFVIISLIFIFSCSDRKIATKNDDPNNNTNEIQISGAFALYPMVVKWAEEFKKENPEVRIDISGGGAGKGMTDVISGIVDLGMVSRELHKEEIKKGAYSITVAKDAVVATINENNPGLDHIKKIGLKKEVASKLWNNTISYWNQIDKSSKNNYPIRIYTRADACGAAETWAAWINKKQEDLEGIAVYGDPGVASAVQKDKFAIGFNNIAYVYDLKSQKPYKGLTILPIDINNNGIIDKDENFYDDLKMLLNAVSEKKYPSPPARNLYIITKGKPIKPIVVKFLKFVLSKGQKYTLENGYVALSEEDRKEELKKLN